MVLNNLKYTRLTRNLKSLRTCRPFDFYMSSVMLSNLFSDSKTKFQLPCLTQIVVCKL